MDDHGFDMTIFNLFDYRIIEIENHFLDVFRDDFHYRVQSHEDNDAYLTCFESILSIEPIKGIDAIHFVHATLRDRSSRNSCS